MTNDRTGGTSDSSGNPPVESLDSLYMTPFELCDELYLRGFKDADRYTAEWLLERVSFQHFLPYLKSIEHTHMSEVPTIKQAHDLLTLDRRFQAAAFKYIGVLESQLRAQYGDAMAFKYGDYPQYDANLFLREREYQKTMEIYSREIERKINRNRRLKRKFESNGGRFPIWVALDMLSLGTVARMFSNTADNDVTSQVAKSFHSSKAELGSWLKTVTDCRNIFAHFDSYLVRKQIPSVPLSVRGAKCANTSPFYIVILLAHMLDTGFVFDDMNLHYSIRIRQDVDEILEQYHIVYDDGMIPGVPENWRDILDVKRTKD